jgi:AcrR family transcriptional regulator
MGSDERRRTILDAASRLFLHYGHAKTTIADIAREAGVAVGSVYLDFASKEAIVQELSASTHVRVLDAMRHAARRNGDDFRARLVAVFEARVAAFLVLQKEGMHARELVHCKAEGVVSAHARFREEEHAFLRQLLEDAEDEHLIANVDARRTAALLQRAYTTLAPPWVFEVEPDEATRIAVEMAELVLEGLLPRAARATSTRAAAPARPHARPARAKTKR